MEEARRDSILTSHPMRFHQPKKRLQMSQEGPCQCHFWTERQDSARKAWQLTLCCCINLPTRIPPCRTNGVYTRQSIIQESPHLPFAIFRLISRRI